MSDPQPDFTRLAELAEGLGPHQHLCLIYDTQEEQLAAALPYLKSGLERGEKCVYIGDENTAAAVLDAVRKGGTDVDHYLRSGALTITHKRETDLQQGRFDPDWWIGFLSQATVEALAANFPALRILGNTSWAVRGTNSRGKLIELEGRINHFVREHDARVICQYNRNCNAPELILGIIRTHPLVAYGGIVCKNPYYVPPEEFLKPNQPALEVERLLNNILAWERAQQALRRSEDRLRHIIDTIPTMAWSLRPDGAVDFLNQVWLDYTGLSLQEGLEEPNRVVHPDDLPRVMKKWLADMVGGNPSEDEMRMRKADGEYRWFLVRTVPLRDERGTIVKWYGVSIDIEDRKRADEELRQAEDRIRAILEFSPNWIFLKDTEGRYLLVNKEVERVFRINQEQIKGKTDSEISSPEHAAEYRANDLKVLREGLTMEFEEVADLEDGPHTSIVHKFPLFDTHGNIYATGGVATDITERKRAEEALRKSEERWRSVFENSAFGVALTDLDGHFLATNPVYQKIVGYTEEDLRGLGFLDITQEEYREANWTLTTELLEGKRRQFQIEKQYRRKDGSLVWVRNSVSLVPGTESVPRFIMALSEDITERKKAEESLQRSEAYLAAGQRLSHAGSWALSLSSGELYWSQEAYRIFGFDPAKTRAGVNETFLPRIHPEDRPKVEQGLKAAADQKESDEVDYRIVLPDGSIKHIRDVVYPVTDEVGEVVERYGVIMDLTERKRTEEELQRSRDQLRALAARLQSAREEERTKVAREIHDELGQALTAIKIDLSSLGRELPADKKPASESILKLVDETIQSVRRISTELRPAILDAVGLVAAVEWAAGEFEGRTGTTCQLDLPWEDIAIDQERATALFRIFQETLTNVVRHANATVVSVRLAKEDNNLTLRVHDNGTGVSEEQLSAGSSLGILGIRERALLLGGELTISGDPGEGTTVRVRIPETIPPKDIK
jgi:PAS domain S-box-containing protein